MRGDLVEGDDGVVRCGWGASSPEYRAYHDEEWGRPVADGRRIFEKLSLEAFQSGLSWLTILRKRGAFREAFFGFDPAAVAAMGPADVERLMSDRAIVRNRAKIEATIANARAIATLGGVGPLAGLLWSHEPSRRRTPRALAEVPAATPESRALASELRGRGFRHLGPTTLYAAMQALGVVNDHLAGCALRDAAERERESFRRPAAQPCGEG